MDIWIVSSLVITNSAAMKITYVYISVRYIRMEFLGYRRYIHLAQVYIAKPFSKVMDVPHPYQNLYFPSFTF